MGRIKKKYQVRWYKYNLTQPQSREFYTEIGAAMFHWWLLLFNHEKSEIYETED